MRGNGEPFTGRDYGREGEDVEERAKERGDLVVVGVGLGFRVLVVVVGNGRGRSSTNEKVIGEIVGIGGARGSIVVIVISIMIIIGRSWDDSSGADSGGDGGGADASLEAILLFFHGGLKSELNQREIERNRDTDREKLSMIEEAS